ncbi:hypothetical protein SAV14893_099050 [Streptomyces avermitilis]|uniref:Uncharacterized protein n=1 Tax=Streptomyces avermitilis TaxID=33903 RepID=A0A4D4MEV4_STRAX|nr:hypothetical protein SAV14893_099050 [Streptomyces avermitilis]
MAVVGEGVEVGVGCGVVGLAGCAEGGGGGGVEDEGVEGGVLGELVEEVGAVGFGAEDVVELGGGEVGEGGVVEDACGVDDGGEGCCGGWC